MTLIDKAEAALAVANVQFGYYDDASGDWRPLSGPAIISAACKAIHALPARVVGVKPLEWEDFDGLGAKASAFYQANYLIQWWKGEGRYEVALSYPGYHTGYDGERWHPTLDAAKAAAQADYEARILSALAPTDSAQAREAHLREAAAAVRARYMGDNNREDMEVLRCEAAILALIGDRT